MEVTKRIEFTCCYIYDHQIEAHQCKLEVTVDGPQRFDDFGRVISYESLAGFMKSIVPDKSFLYSTFDLDSSNVADAFKCAGCNIVPFDFVISAENLCRYFATSLQEMFDLHEPGIRIIDMKFREDNNSYVSWRREH